MMDMSVMDLPVDHPGVDDQDYRHRRAQIAALAGSWVPGAAIPIAEYTAAEHDVGRCRSLFPKTTSLSCGI